MSTFQLLKFGSRLFSPEEIADFVLQNDPDDVFLSAQYNKDHFLKAIKRMIDVNQVIIEEREGILKAVGGWYFVNESNKHEATKITWRLPENITDGDILYVSFVVLKYTNIGKVKKFFDENLRFKTRKVKWYYKGHLYEKEVSKGVRNA